MILRLIRNGNGKFAIEVQNLNDESWVKISRWFKFRLKAVAFAQKLFDKEIENELVQQITVIETYSGGTIDI